MQFLNKYSEWFYADLRIIAGFMFALHGVQKCFGALGGNQADNPLIWAAGVIELVGGALVAVGLWTRPAAFICSGTMAVAFFFGHVFGFGQGFTSLLPIVNKGELAALYCWVFLFIAAKGAGLFSVDSGLKRG